MIEVGRSEKIIIEMDQLAHEATRTEINVYRGNWWIRSLVDSLKRGKLRFGANKAST